MAEYLTFHKIRTSLFLHSYANYRLKEHIRRKYKLKDKLTPKELRRQYYNKRAIPEISKLSHSLNLPYKQTWEAIILGKPKPLNKRAPDREKIKAYLAIETELISLSQSQLSKTSSFFDPEYDQEFAILSIAIERAVGNKLVNIKSDSAFEHQQDILQKLYLRWYYKVAWKYKLPTTRIIPFIVRLIS